MITVILECSCPLKVRKFPTKIYFRKLSFLKSSYESVSLSVTLVLCLRSSNLIASLGTSLPTLKCNRTWLILALLLIICKFSNIVVNEIIFWNSLSYLRSSNKTVIYSSLHVLYLWLFRIQTYFPF